MGLAIAQHNTLQPDWTNPPPLTRLHHYIFVCFKGFMVDVQAWAVSDLAKCRHEKSTFFGAVSFIVN
jgi:hypothetical protein